MKSSASGRTLCAALVMLTLAASGVAAQSAIRQERVKFKPGTSSATIKGTLKGDHDVDYLLGAAAGQTMTVTLAASNTSAYFNVMPPGSQGDAIFVGSTSGNTFSAPLASSGDYTVRVYLMRNAARRNESSSYTVTFTITSGPAGTAPRSDARVKGTPYNATGMVPCSIGSDAPGSAQCGFGVIRGSPGNADVHLAPPGVEVTAPGATTHVIRFTGSTVTAVSSGIHLKSTKQGDEWSITIDDHEHYVIPAAVIMGG